MEIWLVTSGRYSDYGVVGLCSTQEKAKRLMANVFDANEPFSMTVDETERTVPIGFSGWNVAMDRDGNVRKVELWNVYRAEQLGAMPYGQGEDDNGLDNCYGFVVVAKDLEGAVKVANEKRVQLIALNGWFEGPEAFVQHSKWRVLNPHGHRISPPTV